LLDKNLNSIKRQRQGGNVNDREWLATFSGR